jgi:hypothetical protein
MRSEDGSSTTEEEESSASDSDDQLAPELPAGDISDESMEDDEDEDEDDENDENGVEEGFFHEVQEADIREGTLEDLTICIQRSLTRVQNVQKALQPDPDPVAVASIPDECIICYKGREDMLKNMVVMNCGHVLCNECWKNLRAAVCPTCRAGVWSIAFVGELYETKRRIECAQQ